eukprot:GHVL01014051.1.p1 GENE.GHVL01014051.1~~GHVL01014051.1.p1  ORF type:complete len:2299 (-),score=565.78 GHVL01014051.1:61-6957(-)
MTNTLLIDDRNSVFLPIHPDINEAFTVRPGFVEISLFERKFSAAKPMDYKKSQSSSKLADGTCVGSANLLGKCFLSIFSLKTDVLLEDINAPIFTEKDIQECGGLTDQDVVKKLASKTPGDRTRIKMSFCSRAADWVYSNSKLRQYLEGDPLKPSGIYIGSCAILFYKKKFIFPKNQKEAELRLISEEINEKKKKNWKPRLRAPYTVGEYLNSNLKNKDVFFTKKKNIPDNCKDIIPHQFVLPGSETVFLRNNGPGSYSELCRQTDDDDEEGYQIGDIVRVAPSETRSILVTVVAAYPDNTVDVLLNIPEKKIIIEEESLDCLPGMSEELQNGQLMISRVHLSCIQSLFHAGCHIYQSDDHSSPGSPPGGSFVNFENSIYQSLPYDSNPTLTNYEYLLKIHFESEAEMKNFIFAVMDGIRNDESCHRQEMQSFRDRENEDLRERLRGTKVDEKDMGRLELVLVEAHDIRPDAVPNIRQTITHAAEYLPKLAAYSLQNQLSKTLNIYVEFNYRFAHEKPTHQNSQRSPTICSTNHPRWFSSPELSDSFGYTFRTPILKTSSNLIADLSVWHEDLVNSASISKMFVGYCSFSLMELMDISKPFHNMWIPVRQNLQQTQGDLHLMSRYIPNNRKEMRLKSVDCASAKEYKNLLIDCSKSIPDAAGLPVSIGWYNPNVITTLKSVLYQLDKEDPEKLDKLKLAALARLNRERAGKMLKEDIIERPVTIHIFEKVIKEKFLNSDAYRKGSIKRQETALLDVEKKLQKLDKILPFSQVCDSASNTTLAAVRAMPKKEETSDLESSLKKLYCVGLPALRRGTLWMQLTYAMNLQSNYPSVYGGFSSDVNMPQFQQLSEDLVDMRGWSTGSTESVNEQHANRLTETSRVCRCLIMFSNGINSSRPEDLSPPLRGVLYSKSLATVIYYLLALDSNRLTESNVFWLILSLVGYHGPYGSYWGVPMKAKPSSDFHDFLPEKQIGNAIQTDGDPMMSPSGAFCDSMFLECIVAVYLPSIWRKLNSIGFSIREFFYPRFLQLFARTLTSGCLFRFWDVLFLAISDPQKSKIHSRKPLLSLSFAVISANQVNLLACLSCREAIHTLTNAFETTFDDSIVEWGDVQLFEMTSLIQYTHASEMYAFAMREYVNCSEKLEKQNELLKWLTTHPSLDNNRLTTSDVANMIVPSVVSEVDKKDPKYEFGGFMRPLPAEITATFQPPDAKGSGVVNAMTPAWIKQAMTKNLRISPCPIPCMIPRGGGNMTPRGTPGGDNNSNFPPDSDPGWITVDFESGAKSTIEKEEDDKRKIWLPFGCFPKKEEVDAMFKSLVPGWGPIDTTIFSHEDLQGRISIHEFLINLIICSSGNISQKISLFFDIFSIKNDEINPYLLGHNRRRSPRMAEIIIDKSSQNENLRSSWTRINKNNKKNEKNENIKICIKFYKKNEKLDFIADTYIDDIFKYQSKSARGGSKDIRMLTLFGEGKNNSGEIGPVGRIWAAMSWQRQSSDRGELAVFVEKIQVFADSETLAGIPRIEVLHVKDDEERLVGSALTLNKDSIETHDNFFKTQRSSGERWHTFMIQGRTCGKLSLKTPPFENGFISLSTCRLITLSIFNRALYYMSMREVIQISDSIFSRFGEVPSIIEAILTNEEGDRSIDVTNQIILEWERQLNNTGNLKYFITDDNCNLRSIGLSVPSWAKQLKVRYIQSGSGERVHASWPIESKDLVVDNEDENELFLDFDSQSSDECHQIDRRHFYSAFLDSPMLSEALRRVISLDTKTCSLSPLDIDVMVSTLGDKRPEIDQSVFVQVWIGHPLIGMCIGDFYLPPLHKTMNGQIRLNLSTNQGSKADGLLVKVKWAYPMEDNIPDMPRMEEMGCLKLSILSFSGIKKYVGEDEKLTDVQLVVFTKNQKTNNIKKAVTHNGIKFVDVDFPSAVIKDDFVSWGGVSKNIFILPALIEMDEDLICKESSMTRWNDQHLCSFNSSSGKRIFIEDSVEEAIQKIKLSIFEKKKKTISCSYVLFIFQPGPDVQICPSLSNVTEDFKLEWFTEHNWTPLDVSLQMRDYESFFYGKAYARLIKPTDRWLLRCPAYLSLKNHEATLCDLDEGNEWMERNDVEEEEEDELMSKDRPMKFAFSRYEHMLDEDASGMPSWEWRPCLVHSAKDKQYNVKWLHYLSKLCADDDKGKDSHLLPSDLVQLPEGVVKDKVFTLLGGEEEGGATSGGGGAAGGGEEEDDDEGGDSDLIFDKITLFDENHMNCRGIVRKYHYVATPADIVEVINRKVQKMKENAPTVQLRHVKDAIFRIKKFKMKKILYKS